MKACLSLNRNGMDQEPDGQERHGTEPRRIALVNETANKQTKNKNKIK